MEEVVSSHLIPEIKQMMQEILLLQLSSQCCSFFLMFVFSLSSYSFSNTLVITLTSLIEFHELSSVPSAQVGILKAFKGSQVGVFSHTP